MSEEGSEQEQPKEIVPPPAGKKIFLSHCNTFEGRAMFKELWNKEKFAENPEWEYAAHTFTGTVRTHEKNARGGFEEPPSGINSFVDFERTESFRSKLLDSNVIIYDLMSNSFEEVDYVIKTLKTSDLQEEKTLVLLSSVMTWVNTPPKLEEDKPEGEEEEEGEGAAEDEPSEEEPPSEEEEENKEGAEEEEEKEEELDENGEPIVVKQPLYFKETDYHLRVPHVAFNSIKTLETTAMSSVNTQPKLKVHVLCSGIRYGNGERTFYDHFQKAWIQEPVELPIIGDGENLVPTIHIIDLARLVRRVVIENPKVHPYIFAIDKTRKPTQKRIITEVSKGMGTGKIRSVSAEEVSEVQGWKETLTINLRMQASDAFKAVALTTEEQELEDEDEKNKLTEEKKFPWHAKFGIRKCIRSLEGEFNEHRGLNPVKIFVTGPPASGKTFYSQELAKYYNIPRVHVRQLVDEVFRMAAIEEEAAGENKLINDCRTKLEEIKAAMEEEITEKRADLEEPEDGWPEIEITNDQIRIPDELLWEVLKLKLGENDCRNRGYILDGFPRAYKGAQNSFLKKVIKYDEEGQPIEDDEEELPEGEEPSFDNHVKNDDIFPGSIVVLEGNDSDLISRVRELPEDQIHGTHYNLEDMKRRIKSYRTLNNSTIAEPAVQDFFQQQGIKFYKESILTRTKDALHGFKIYIERNEKPFNYMTYDEDEEEKRRAEYETVQAAIAIQKIAQGKQEENLEKIIKKQKESQTKYNIEVFREQQKDILDTQSQHIRMYLADNLVTFLAEGLQDICFKQPDDPVDALAEYLFKRSLEVRYKDPTQY